jgi:hypothetical protein
MENEQPNNEGANVGSDEGGEAGAPRRDPHLERTIKDRNAWKQKATEASAKLAEIEAERQKHAEERDRAAGDWSKVEQRYQRQIAEMQAQLDEVTGKLTERDKGDRRSKFAAAIAADGNVGNVRLVERLLPTLGLEDDAPEAFNKLDVKDALKRLQADAPELFGKNNAIKPPPGGGERPPDNQHDHWKQKAAARSSGGLSSGYAAATGRKQ